MADGSAKLQLPCYGAGKITAQLNSSARRVLYQRGASITISEQLGFIDHPIRSGMSNKAELSYNQCIHQFC